MKREEAIKVAIEMHGWLQTDREREALETLIPELRESEDERIRKEIIDHLVKEVGLYPGEDRKEHRWLRWLEKQKKQKPTATINGEPIPTENHSVNIPLAEWSEEDKDYYDTIVRKLEVIGDDSGLSNNQIKFLREHCPSHCSGWSEEDEMMLNSIIATCELAEQDRHSGPAEHLLETQRIWLKSLRPQPHTVAIENATKFGNLEYERGVKDGIQHSENHRWKPSEEQMTALERSIHYLSDYGMNDDDLILRGLHEELVKNLLK